MADDMEAIIWNESDHSILSIEGSYIVRVSRDFDDMEELASKLREFDAAKDDRFVSISDLLADYEGDGSD